MKYIIRLDDACPTMNHENWKSVVELLDAYEVKPIVGVIPDNLDTNFHWKVDEFFWDEVKNWEKRGWCIGLHGLTHKMKHCDGGKIYYQKSHSTNTEFAGVAYDEQLNMLRRGNELLISNGVIPKCFFAPAHTYDKNTVRAIHKINPSMFISDGYSFSIYKKDNVVFVPSICDGPFSLPSAMRGGVMTYVFHPSTMKEYNFGRLRKFLEKEHNNIISIDQLNISECNNKQGVTGLLLEYGIHLCRGIRDIKSNIFG